MFTKMKLNPITVSQVEFFAVLKDDSLGTERPDPHEDLLSEDSSRGTQGMRLFWVQQKGTGFP